LRLRIIVRQHALPSSHFLPNKPQNDVLMLADMVKGTPSMRLYTDKSMQPLPLNFDAIHRYEWGTKK
jgi:hypothetical protein